MSDKKQTFTDPKTGEEIESTWLARLAFRLFVVIIGLYSMLFGYNFSLGIMAFLFGLIALLGVISRMDDSVRTNFIEGRIHDAIARAQHFRRQQLLQRKLAEEEWAGVPDRALSRANPSIEPQATDGALSLSNGQRSEDGRRIRLTESVGKETTGQLRSVDAQ